MQIELEKQAPVGEQNPTICMLQKVRGPRTPDDLRWSLNAIGAAIERGAQLSIVKRSRSTAT